MRLLLDTHALLWWLLGSTKLSDDARSSIADRNLSVLVSPVSAFEVTLKHRLGKLPDAADIASGFGGMLVEEGFVGLPLSVEAALLAGSLIWHHKDPFDRLLVAQALADDLVIVSNEAVFDATGIKRLW